MNINGCDEMIVEYCTYRGFYKTLKILEEERLKDKTKMFEASEITGQIFDYLTHGEITSFMQLWSFLDQRFFIHLDQEHSSIVSTLKVDILRYYLASAFKDKNIVRITNFFSMYSHEILSRDSMSPSSSLRSWYALPYMESPEKDAEFSPYFAPNFREVLVGNLSNYLSIIICAAPPPKLLLIERWFRAEQQQDLRRQVKESMADASALRKRVSQLEATLQSYQNMVMEVTAFVQSKCRNQVLPLRIGINGDVLDGDGEEEGLKRSQVLAQGDRLLDDLAGQQLLQVQLQTQTQGESKAEKSIFESKSTELSEWLCNFQ